MKSLTLARPPGGSAGPAGAAGAASGVVAAAQEQGRSGEVTGGTDEMSPCESIGGDATTCAGSFCLPTGNTPPAGGDPQIPEAGGGVPGGYYAGGDDNDDGFSRGGVEVQSEAELTVVAGAERSSGSGAVSSGAMGGMDDAGVAGRHGGSLLDAYREPEAHDWGELEDWHGLPGLQLAGGGSGATIRPRLQVKNCVLLVKVTPACCVCWVGTFGGKGRW